MKDGKCPKCNATDIFCGSELRPKSGPFGSNSIPINLTSIAALDNYVCTQCGYVESYISDKSKLKEIFIRWPKVG